MSSMFVIRTLKVALKKWDEFGRIATLNGTNRSELIRAYIDTYIAENKKTARRRPPR